MTNVDLTAVKMDGCNQAIFIAADIEDNQIADLIS